MWYFGPPNKPKNFGTLEYGNLAYHNPNIRIFCSNNLFQSTTIIRLNMTMQIKEGHIKSTKNRYFFRFYIKFIPFPRKGRMEISILFLQVLFLHISEILILPLYGNIANNVKIAYENNWFLRSVVCAVLPPLAGDKIFKITL